MGKLRIRHLLVAGEGVHADDVARAPRLILQVRSLDLEMIDVIDQRHVEVAEERRRDEVEVIRAGNRRQIDLVPRRSRDPRIGRLPELDAGVDESR